MNESKTESLSGIIQQFEFHDWEQFKAKLSDFGHCQFLFRGQRSDRWGLETKIERLGVQDLVAVEEYVLDKFRGRVHHYCQPGHEPNCDLEMLSLMQHHGAPTRLLDWTFSPYVAAFFAFCDVKSPDEGCSIWAIEGSWLSQAARERLWVDGGIELRSLEWNDDDVFRTLIRSNDHEMVVPVRPYRMNQRERTQQGTFLCAGSLRCTFEENLISLGRKTAAAMPQKFNFLGDMRAEVMTDLARMNITAETLFPGLDGFARSLEHEVNSFGIPEMMERHRLRRAMRDATP